MSSDDIGNSKSKFSPQGFMMFRVHFIFTLYHVLESFNVYCYIVKYKASLNSSTKRYVKGRDWQTCMTKLSLWEFCGTLSIYVRVYIPT